MARIPIIDQPQVSDRGPGSGLLRPPQGDPTDPHIQQYLRLGASLEQVGTALGRRQNQIDNAVVQEMEAKWKNVEAGFKRFAFSQTGPHAREIFNTGQGWFDNNADFIQEEPDSLADSIVYNAGAFEAPGSPASPEDRQQVIQAFQQLGGEDVPEAEVVPQADAGRPPRKSSLTEEERSYLKAYENLTPRQRASFDMIRNARRGKFLNQIFAHETQQVRAWTETSFLNNAKLSVDQAVANAQDEEAVIGELSNINRYIRSTAKTLDWDQDRIDVERSNYFSDVHGGVVEARLNNNDVAGARDYFKRYKTEILGGRQSQLKKMLSETGDLIQAQQIADANAHLGPAEFQKQVARKHEGTLRELIEERYTKNRTFSKQAETDRQNEQYNAIYDHMEQSSREVFTFDQAGNMVEYRTSIGIQDLPGNLKSQYHSLPVAMQESLKKAGEAWRVPPEDVVLDARDELNDMFGSTDPATVREFANMNLRVEYQDRLPPEEIKAFQEKQVRARAALAGGEDGPDSAITIQQTINPLLESIFPGAEFKAHRAAFNDMINRRITGLEAEGKTVGPAQVRAIAGDLLKQGAVSQLRQRYGLSRDPGGVTLAQQVEGWVDTHDPDLSSKDRTQLINRLEGAVRQRVVDQESLRRRAGLDNVKLTNQEIDLIVRTQAEDKVQVEDGGFFFFDSEKYAWEVTEDELGAAYVMVEEKKFPLTHLLEFKAQDPAKYREMRNTLVARGTAPTWQNMAEAFVEGHQAGRVPGPDPLVDPPQAPEVTHRRTGDTRRLDELVEDWRKTPLDELEDMFATGFDEKGFMWGDQALNAMKLVLKSKRRFGD